MLLIPDVHGRDFWREVKDKDDKIIFLGDYVDPYSYEGFTREDAIQALSDIIELKKSKPDKVILLLGNHDFAYVTDLYDIRSRYDYENAPKLQKLFRDNLDLFQMAHQEENIIFSHAGIHPEWLKEYYPGQTPESFVEIANSNLKNLTQSFVNSLMSCGYSRGGWAPVGSMIWSDVSEWLKYTGIFQIFGHTQLKQGPLVTGYFADLDCRKWFDLNKIRES